MALIPPLSSEKPPASYRIRTLGGLAVETSEGAPAFPGTQRKALALLALLAVARDSGVTREKVFGYLWPESDAPRASNALSQVLFRLRRELGAEIVTGNGALRLHDAVAADVSEFRDALQGGAPQAAVELYRGPFLDGFFLSDAPEFERWSDQQREQLAQDATRAMEKLAASATRAGERRLAAEWWRRVALQDPLSNRVARAYMEALAAAGNVAAALDHCARHAEFVRAELGVGADAELLKYAEQLRAQVPPQTAAVRVRGERITAPPVAEPAPAPMQSTARRPARRILVGAAALVATAFAWIVLRPGLDERLIRVERFVAGDSDSSLAPIADDLAHSASTFLAAMGGIRVADASESARPALVVSALVRRAAGDSLVIFPVIHDRRRRANVALSAVGGTIAARDALARALHSRLGGAVAALTDARLPELADELPALDAYWEYSRGVDALVATGNARGHFTRAAQLDTGFIAPRLGLLLSGSGGGQDTLITWFQQRLGMLPRAPALAFEILQARRGHDLEAAYRLSGELRRQYPERAHSQLEHARSALAWNRFRAAEDAAHALRRSRGWHAELRGAWQLDLDAHHGRGDLRGAIAEWRALDTAVALSVEGCHMGIRQFAAAGDGRMVDSLVGVCAPRDESAMRSRMGRRIQLEDELLRFAGREFRWHGHDSLGRRALLRAYDVAQAYLAIDSAANNGWLALQLLGEWRRAHALMTEEILKQGACAEADRRPICSLRARVRYSVTAANAGDSLPAIRTLAWIARRTHGDSIYLVERAKVELALGRREEAVRSLRAAQRHVSPWYHMHWNMDLLPLRDDPRFQAIVAAR